MANGVFSVPAPRNEPVLSYAPGTTERVELHATCMALSRRKLEIAPVIGGRRVRTGKIEQAVMPHEHKHVLATWHRASGREVARAIAAAREAWHDWSRTPWEARAAVFLKAADLLAGPWRQKLNAATVLGQSKTCHQAEIDAACERVGKNPKSLIRTICPLVRMPGGVGRFSEYPGEAKDKPLDGTDPAALADELRAYADMGVGHVQLVLDPINAASIAALKPVLDLLDRN